MILKIAVGELTRQQVDQSATLLTASWFVGELSSTPILFYPLYDSHVLNLQSAFFTGGVLCFNMYVHNMYLYFSEEVFQSCRLCIV